MTTPELDPRLIRLHPKRTAVRPASLLELIDALDERARALECAHDARHIFAAEYARHIELVEAMRRASVFKDASAWIERLMLEQAAQYFRALNSWDAGDLSLTAAPWRALFVRARYEELPSETLSRLSVIVHTAYDLPLALARSPFEDAAEHDARRAFDRLPALVINEHPSFRRALHLGRHEISSDAGLRPQAWEDGIHLLDASNGDALRATFTKIETRALLKVAG